jgi:trigger factor
VDEMLDKLRQQRTVWKDVERGASDGDTVHIDFEGRSMASCSRAALPKDVPLVLGSGAMIEGFESGLLGARAGEERILEVTFPADYRAENLAGKAATFEVKVHRVAEPQLPEVDEDFVKAFGVDEGTLEALRGNVRKNMAHELTQKIRAKVKNQVMDVLVQANPLDRAEGDGRPGGGAHQAADDAGDAWARAAVAVRSSGERLRRAGPSPRPSGLCW